MIWNEDLGELCKSRSIASLYVKLRFRQGSQTEDYMLMYHQQPLAPTILLDFQGRERLFVSLIRFWGGVQADPIRQSLVLSRSWQGRGTYYPHVSHDMFPCKRKGFVGHKMQLSCLAA